MTSLLEALMGKSGKDKEDLLSLVQRNQPVGESLFNTDYFSHLDPQKTGEMKSYDPSYRDWMTDWARRGLMELGVNKYEADHYAKGAVGIGETLNVPFAAFTAASLLLAALSAIPGAGKGRKVAEKAENLAMDEASRVARGTENGHWPMTWYHGTGNDVSEFDPAMIGQATGSPVKGFSFTSSPELASDFAEHAAKRGVGNAPNVIPARLKWKNPHVVNAEGASLSPMEIQANLMDAIEGGKDILIIRNVSMGVEGKPARTSDVAIALRPDQIRSVFAKFDPKNASSGNLLASLAGAGLLVPISAEMYGRDGGD